MIESDGLQLMLSRYDNKNDNENENVVYCWTCLGSSSRSCSESFCRSSSCCCSSMYRCLTAFLRPIMYSWRLPWFTIHSTICCTANRQTNTPSARPTHRLTVKATLSRTSPACNAQMKPCARAVLCLHAAPRVQLSFRAASGWWRSKFKVMFLCGCSCDSLKFETESEVGKTCYGTVVKSIPALETVNNYTAGRNLRSAIEMSLKWFMVSGAAEGKEKSGGG